MSFSEEQTDCLSKVFTPRILLVDDDVDFCKLLQKHAKRRKICLDYVTSIREGKLASKSGAFTSYIIDGYLPDGTGIDLIKWIQRVHGKNVAIAFASSEIHEGSSLNSLNEILQVKHILRKPLSSEELDSLFKELTLSPYSSSASEQDLSFLQELREEYWKSCDEKIAHIGQLINNVIRDSSQENLEILKVELHKIAGSAGSYGLPEVSKVCKAMELDTIHCIRDPSLINFSWLRTLKNVFFVKFQDAFNKTKEKGFQKKPPPPPETTDQKISADIFMITDDKKLLDEVIKEGKRVNLAVSGVTSTEEALPFLKSPLFSPSILIVNHFYFADPVDGCELVTTYKEYHSSTNCRIGMIFLQGEISDRMIAIQAGVDFFLEQPLNTETFITTIQETLSKEEKEESKILLIDDDEDIHKLCRLLLKDLPVKLESLKEGSRIFEILDSFHPQLLLLDLGLPTFSGIEILKALRADMRYNNLPVIIITGSATKEDTKQSYNLKISDYIEKPFNPNTFHLKISNFIEQNNLVKKSQQRDPLTNLFNRRAFLERFDFVYSSSTRNHHNLSLAILDLDYFKEINDRYGHVIGDKCLQETANLLVKQVRTTDTVGRWGGEEFVILFQETTLIEAHFLMGNILEVFLQNFSIPNLSEIWLSFSTGIASFPEDGLTFHELFSAADRLLYQAKAEGRSRIFSNYFNNGSNLIEGYSQEVFLITDNLDISSTIERSLNSMGILLREATTSEKIQQAIKDNQASLFSPELIILDREFQEKDGLLLLKTFQQKKAFSKVPVILLSSRGEEEEIQKCLVAGCSSYVAKPLSLTALMHECLRELKQVHICKAKQVKRQPFNKTFI